ncbi:MAG: hypothetical protein U1E83_10175 [Methylotetracoccus sp.]
MAIHNPHRRDALRRLLVGGCALCMARLGGAQAGKLSKIQAQYQDQPHGDQVCGNCMHFIAPNACMVVEGDISPGAWCTLWAKKQG